jgi:ATP-dependent DNA ligase
LRQTCGRKSHYPGREALIGLLRKTGGGLRLSEHVDGAHGLAIYRAACGMGLEGIVSKRVDRSYRSGRCADWIKMKNPEAPAATRVIEGSTGPHRRSASTTTLSSQ